MPGGMREIGDILSNLMRQNSNPNTGTVYRALWMWSESVRSAGKAGSELAFLFWIVQLKKNLRSYYWRNRQPAAHDFDHEVVCWRPNVYHNLGFPSGVPCKRWKPAHLRVHLCSCWVSSNSWMGRWQFRCLQPGTGCNDCSSIVKMTGNLQIFSSKFLSGLCRHCWNSRPWHLEIRLPGTWRKEKSRKKKEG